MLGVLREIRDEVKEVKAGIRETNLRLERLEGRVESLERTQSEAEMRVATELIAVTQAVDGVRDLLRDRLDLRDKVDDHERRIGRLEVREH